MQDLHRYDDILHLPHHVSATRMPMPRMNRAAQFTPFDALNGYSAAIRETARQTQCRLELDDSAKHRLNRKLQRLLQMSDQPEITVTWFRPDTRKAGGAYVITSGQFQKMDVFRGLLVMDCAAIPMEDIRRLDCEQFPVFDDLA